MIATAEKMLFSLKGKRVWVAGHRGMVGAALVRLLRARGFTNLLLRTHAELDLCDARAILIQVYVGQGKWSLAEPLLVEQIEHADQVGLDVFGIGEHHRRDYLDSAPPIILAAAKDTPGVHTKLRPLID